MDGLIHLSSHAMASSYHKNMQSLSYLISVVAEEEIEEVIMGFPSDKASDGFRGMFCKKFWSKPADVILAIKHFFTHDYIYAFY